MGRYRYRTPALTGPWRDSQDEAVGDAVKAKQAEVDDGSASGIRWIVPGRIEERAGGAAPKRLRN